MNAPHTLQIAMTIDADKPIGGLSDEQFERWTRLLKRRTGIDIGMKRRIYLETNLRMRMREAGYGNYDDYYAHVVNGRTGAREWVKLIDRLTVHETRFNRHPPSLALVQEYLGRRFPAGGEQASCSLDVWSVGCASGEEAYSLAIILERFCRSRQGSCYYGVTATDVSRGTLEFARRGEYPLGRLGTLTALEIAEYFIHVEEGIYRVRDDLRERICFAQQNILDLGDAPLGMMDIIFCQNVLIYFTLERRHEILESLARYLKPGGLLVLGIGEAAEWKQPGMERVAFKDTLAFLKVRG